MKTAIGISDKHLKKSSSLLSIVLADEMLLYVKTRKAHWNVSGESFMELHKLYENQYKKMEAIIDEVAERIGKLGQKTIGSMEEFLKLSTLKESPGNYSSTKETIKELLKNHEAIIVELRKNIEVCSETNNDAGTADFLTGIMKDHETIAWILRRYLN